MAEIPLTQGMTALVDDADYDHLARKKWHAKRRSNTWYAGTNVRDGKRYRWVSMHRYITDAPKDTVVDHRDSNGLNNTRDNLRVCTQSQNMRNRRGYGRSQYLGVAYDESSGAARP